MKKLFQWVFAATLIISGFSVLTSCSSDDNPATPDLNVAEKIIGKWMKTEKDGQPLPTDGKMVYTFVSPTKAYMSASIDASAEMGTHWITQLEADVTITGNKVSLITYSEEGATMVVDYNITAIDDKSFTANHKVTITLGGAVVYVVEDILRFEKVTIDYAPAIIGMWECQEVTGGETYNDSNARLEFLADGTYRYYRQADGGQWKAVHSREFEDYFVDGYLINTRWKERGEDEQREWWEIKSISGDQMVWMALRQNADGSTFQQEVRWKKVDFNLAEKIIGKWMTAEIYGQPALTNEKSVLTFLSATKATVSVSRTDFTKSESKWIAHLEFDVESSGNKMTLTGHLSDNVTQVQEYTVTAINDAQMLANVKLTMIRNGEATVITEQYVRYEKVTADYREAILGLWECTELTGVETYNDANARLEFFADGTYKYWRKNDAGEWEAVTTRDYQDYFVDGTLLATRWKNQGEDELREWWEIASIADGQMHWTALRQNADGSTVQQGMKWVKE